MSIAEMKEYLPHREPFLYVDRIEECNNERITGYRKYTDDDYFFKGHFPDYPVVPGVLIVEAMAQCGGVGLGKSKILEKGVVFFLGSIEKAKFRRQVRPGDELRMEIVNERIGGKIIRQSGTAYVEDEVAAEASWLCIRSDMNNVTNQ